MDRPVRPGSTCDSSKLLAILLAHPAEDGKVTPVAAGASRRDRTQGRARPLDRQPNLTMYQPSPRPSSAARDAGTARTAQTLPLHADADKADALACFLVWACIAGSGIATLAGVAWIIREVAP